MGSMKIVRSLPVITCEWW